MLFLLIFADRLVCLFNLKLNIMETTINTFCKFKEYKEKRVRELIWKYNVFLGMPWGLIIVICGICCLLLLNIPNFASKNSYLKVALILSSAFAILAIVKYIRSLQIQKVVYDCLNCFSDFESKICSKIEVDTLRKQMQVNDNEIVRLTYLNDNLDLKCKIINRILWINYRKSFIYTIFSMNQDEYKKMIENKTVLLQERCSYRQSQNKYKADIQLLKTKNEDLAKRIEIIEKTVVDDKQELTNVNKKLKSALESKTFISKIFISEILKSEIILFFTDLIEVVSQIKIQ